MCLSHYIMIFFCGDTRCFSRDAFFLSFIVSTFLLVPGLTNAAIVTPQLAGGTSHTIALASDGSVWAWGSNYGGQLGNEVSGSTFNPTVIASLGEVRAIAAGGDNSAALKGDGTVWTWGNNFYGQLGNGTTATSNTPVQVSGLGSVTALSASGDHTAALKTDGTVWTWGGNDSGQLGQWYRYQFHCSNSGSRHFRSEINCGFF